MDDGSRTFPDNIISLTTGDWSGDGHCMSDRTLYKSNSTRDDITSAYRLGVKVVGFDITCHCEDYEDSRISREDADLCIKESLIDKFDSDDYLTDEDFQTLFLEEYVKIWIATVQAGNPSIVMVEMKTDGNINIDGYGLYST